jgi:hypothetical protein
VQLFQFVHNFEVFEEAPKENKKKLGIHIRSEKIVIEFKSEEEKLKWLKLLRAMKLKPPKGKLKNLKEQIEDKAGRRFWYSKEGLNNELMCFV